MIFLLNFTGFVDQLLWDCFRHWTNGHSWELDLTDGVVGIGDCVDYGVGVPVKNDPRH